MSTPACPTCSRPMHVEYVRNGARHFKCYEDGATLRESRENRILRPGRPPKGSPRPKRVR